MSEPNEDVAKLRALMQKYQQDIEIARKQLEGIYQSLVLMSQHVRDGLSMVSQLSLPVSSAPVADGVSATTGKEPSSP